MSRTVDRLLLGACWIGQAFVPIGLTIGHLGDHELHWQRDPLSVYAVRAPLGPAITMAICSAAAAMLVFGVIVPRCFEHRSFAPMLSMGYGIAASGLLLIARFPGPLPPLSSFDGLPAGQIRDQLFHEAGLMLFFSTFMATLVCTGFALVLLRRHTATRALGACASVVAATAPQWFSHGSMGAFGLHQRLAFLFLWISACIILTVVSREA